MNREDFPMLNHNYIYLDNGATTWKPIQVIDKINEYYKDIAYVWLLGKRKKKGRNGSVVELL